MVETVLMNKRLILNLFRHLFYFSGKKMSFLYLLFSAICNLRVNNGHKTALNEPAVFVFFSDNTLITQTSLPG